MLPADQPNVHATARAFDGRRVSALGLSSLPRPAWLAFGQASAACVVPEGGPRRVPSRGRWDKKPPPRTERYAVTAANGARVLSVSNTVPSVALPGVLALELPRGLALNSFRLICPGTHTLLRVERPATREARLELQKQIGHYLFTKDDYAYTFAEASTPDSTVVELGCDLDHSLHLFDLRSIIAAHASRRGLDPRFHKGGEIQITGLAGEVQVDGIRVQKRLRLRVTEDGYPDLETRIVGRQDTRWLVEGSLARAEVRNRAVGERAERLLGNGPRRGEVMRINDESVVLRVGDDEVSVPASDYALTVRAAYVRRYHRPDTLTRLHVLSGSLTPTGRRNRYAVKDRFQALLGSMEQFGWAMDMPGGRQAYIEKDWTEVRIQERAT